jgi:uncharacterized protein YcbX
MHLSELNIYPVKSLKGTSLESARVDNSGLQFDRRWMVVTPDGQFMTQREYPVMATIAVTAADAMLTLARNGDSISTHAYPVGTPTIDVMIWNDSGLRSATYDDDVNAWLSEQIGTECKLVTMAVDTFRLVDPNYAIDPFDTVSFADGYPFLLIGEGSLADLNSRLDEPVPMNRFRPNFVVAGSEPFEEDTWKRIRIGSTEFHVVKPCARCVLTTVDQIAGEKSGKEPLATLSSYRNHDGKVLFGQNLIAERAGATISVGDAIEVLEWK